MVTSEINLYGSMKAIRDMCGLIQGLARCVYVLRIDRLIASFIRYQAGCFGDLHRVGASAPPAERLKRRRLRPTLERCNHHRPYQLLRQSVLREKMSEKFLLKLTSASLWCTLTDMDGIRLGLPGFAFSAPMYGNAPIRERKLK